MTEDRFKKMCSGLIVTWKDLEPFGDTQPFDAKVSATTATKRVMIDAFYRRHSAKILNSDLKWMITLDVLFRTPRGIDKRTTEMTVKCKLASWQSNSLCEVIAEAIEEAFAGNEAYPEGHKNKGKYMHCEFKAQIVGV